MIGHKFGQKRLKTYGARVTVYTLFILRRRREESVLFRLKSTLTNDDMGLSCWAGLSISFINSEEALKLAKQTIRAAPRVGSEALTENLPPYCWAVKAICWLDGALMKTHRRCHSKVNKYELWMSIHPEGTPASKCYGICFSSNGNLCQFKENTYQNNIMQCAAQHTHTHTYTHIQSLNPFPCAGFYGDNICYSGYWS